MIDYDHLASEYARHRGVNQEALKDLIATGKIITSSKVLEVGCGTGNYAIAIQYTTGCSCWGVDPSDEMLSKAKARSGTVAFNIGRAEALNFQAGFFDLVFSVDVIHHIGDHDAYFQEAFIELRPGGKVCTVTDSEEIIRNREILAIYFPETVKIELERYPRIAKLRIIMELAGFKSIRENIAQHHAHLTDIQAFRDKAFSSLHLIPEKAFRRGISRMEHDLRNGPISYVESYLLLWGIKPMT